MNPTYIRSDLVSSQDGTSRLKDFILGETSCDVPDAVIEEKAAAWLREAIGRLPQKARYVLVRRYGLDDRDPASSCSIPLFVRWSSPGASAPVWQEHRNSPL